MGFETIFERATRRARDQHRVRPAYEDVLVIYGAPNFRDASTRVGYARLRDADLVLGVHFDADGGNPRGLVLKDRNGDGRRVREQDPCPCRNGRRFGACHGR